MNPVFSKILGLRHGAVAATDLQRSLKFFQELLGFSPYHASDTDWAMVERHGTSLSLLYSGERKRHDEHIALTLENPEAVDELHAFLKEKKLPSVGVPQKHRDGSYGFYLKDPDGNLFECIFIPYVSYTVTDFSYALVLLAHGSRDPEWKVPFERLLQKTRLHAPALTVELAFMEGASPTLSEAVEKVLAARPKTRELRVAPVFLSNGGAHMTRDVPALVNAERAKHPEVTFVLHRAAGEHLAVQEAIVASLFSP
jgi:sirohydrochlorin cobaltochelatase